MKTIFSIVSANLISLILLSQSPFISASKLNVNSKPYLITNGATDQSEQLRSTYNVYRKMMATMENQNQAPLVIKQRLDSIVKVPVDTSLSAHKSAFTYNSNGNITSVSEYSWDKSIADWGYESKEEWTYNASHYNTEYTTYYGDLQNWHNELKYVNTFDQFGRLINVIGSAWDDSSMQWQEGLKIENSYDAAGKDTTTIWYQKNGTSWDPSDKYTYDYDNDSLIIIHSIWNTKWALSDKNDYSYYFTGDEHFHIQYEWDGSGTWANIYQTEARFSSELKLSSFWEYKWDVIGVIWVNANKVEYKYTAVDTNMVLNVNYRYVKQLQGFIIDSRDSCFYNNLYPNANLLLPPKVKFTLTIPQNSDNNVYFNHMLTKSVNYTYNGTIYLKNDTKTFYWSPFNVTKTVNQTISNIQIVPNPTRQYFILSSEDNSPVKLRMYDLNGILKLDKTIQTNEPIQTESLAKGLYLVRIISKDNAVSSGKLIIQ